ncbi:MAG: beta-ketoacyl-ACP synthase II, partial [Candidatus Paceibacterota bacterium]
VGNARQAEVATRYDNNRFAIIMPECDHEQAFRLAERIRKNIVIKSFGRAGNADIQLTASFGITAMYEDMTSERLIEKAEQMLAQSKSDGGNKIRLSPMQGVIQRDKQTPYVYVPNATKKRRVVITGLGPIAPNGIGKDAFWSGVKNGISGIRTISSFDTSELPVKFAGEIVDFDPRDFTMAKNARRLDRFTQLAVAGAKLAVNDASIRIEKINKDMVGVATGTAFGGFCYAAKELARVNIEGQMRVSPYLPSAMLFGASSSQISIELGFTGPSTTFSTGCNSSADAMSFAFDQIKSGRSDVFLVGGTDSPLMPTVVAGFSVVRALSERNENPQAASRPFDLGRDGFVLGEGAAFLVFEELDHAMSRNAKIYGEFLGYGMTCDAYHMTRPEPAGRGMIASMKQALAQASISKTDIQHINAHGSSTPLNDAVETKAIKDVFGDHASNLTVISTKSMIGHSMGAPPALELAATLLAMENEFVPPTINYETPDPDCDLDYVPNVGRQQKISMAMSNSFSFGGKNTCIVVSKYFD